MRLLDQAYNPDNIRRAWKWVQSNPEATYKGYFRGLYANYRTADGELLADLRERLRLGKYAPAHAGKIYLPKRSGGLRAYSLLTVEDQIVYQSLVNVVAERLTPRARERHCREVFSHQYAGKSSGWFYRDWRKGYAARNRAARRAFRDGRTFTASFDLTAFYDSISHDVLRHFLGQLGFDVDFCRRLVECLRAWTATNCKPRILHGHGIPQGPLSSGLLAEVVMQHFDAARRPPDVTYLRYNDDIQLFAAGEGLLHRAVARLDLLSRDVGLFPNTTKMAVRAVADIDAELKSVSGPEVRELDLEAERVDQRKLRGRLRELAPRGRVADSTEFRFLLPRATPNRHLDRLMTRVADNHPDLTANVLRYFQQYPSLPTPVCEWLRGVLAGNPVHATTIAELLDTAAGRVDLFTAREIDGYVRERWRRQSEVRSAQLLGSLGRWGVRRDLLSAVQITTAIGKLPEWWARAEVVSAVSAKALKPNDPAAVLSRALADPVSDVAIAAAAQLGRLGLRPVDGTDLGRAGPVLEAYGLIPAGAGRECGIARSLCRIVGHKLPGVCWQRVYGRSYRHAERLAVSSHSYADVDVTVWVNALDVFNNSLVMALFKRRPDLGICTQRGYGGVLAQPTSRFAAAFPAVRLYAHVVHEKRGESHLSHPWKASGKDLVRPTSFIRHRFMKQGRLLLTGAVRELATQWPAG